MSLKLRQRSSIQPLIPEWNQGLFRCLFTVNTNLQKSKIKSSSSVAKRKDILRQLLFDGCIVKREFGEAKFSCVSVRDFIHAAGMYFMHSASCAFIPLHEQRYFLFTKRTGICKHWDTQGLRNIFPRKGNILCVGHWLYRCLCSGNWSPLRASMNYTPSVYVNTPIRAYESAAGAAHEIPPEGGTKAALRAAWLWRTRQS